MGEIFKFTNAGAEAVENAIKFARLYTGRHKVITLYQGYHGASYGAMSASGDPRGNPHDSQGAPSKCCCYFNGR